MPFWMVRNTLVGRGYWASAGDGDGSSDIKDFDRKPGDKAPEDKKPEDKKPTDAEAALLKEVMEKKKNLKEVQEQLDQVKGQLKQFEGIDPDAVKRLLAEKVDAEKTQLEKKGEFDRLKQMMAEEHQKQITTVQEQLAELQKALGQKDSEIYGLTIGNQFASSTFIREQLAAPASKVKALYADHFEYKDGQIVGFDKPKGSTDRTILVDGIGNALSFESALAKIVNSDPDGDWLVRSKQKPGADSGSTHEKHAPGREVSMRGVEKISAALAEGKF